MAENLTGIIHNGLTDKYEVLVVEDDIILSKAVVKALTNIGYSCKCFFSGHEFLNFSTEAQGLRKPLLLLDYLLPDMDAFQLLTELKSKNIAWPFVVMTGHGDEKTAVEIMKLGAIDYIIKEEQFVNLVGKTIYQAIQKIEITSKLELSRQELFSTAEKLRDLNKQLFNQKLELEREKAKTDKLLYAILPGKIAKELLENGFTQPQQYKLVSILFADVIGFSNLARSEPPIELVNKLNNYFCIFDEIVEQFGLEKIKTIGDCHMCAGGIPEKDLDNPVNAVLAGLKIQQTVQRLKGSFNSSLSEFSFRLGIHTGEVVAGVVGKNKFLYDIWGDAVNIAYLIVEAGEESRVNISEQTYSLVKDYFSFTERGNILTKRNIPIKMYFVDKLLPKFAADKSGILPNEELFNMLEKRKSSKAHEKAL